MHARLSTTMSVEELSKRVDALSSFVEKQAKMIGKTGEQLVSMQVQNVKELMAGGSKPQVDMDDYITNDDIVQLVGELQSQLDGLEERTTRRMFNCQLSVEDDGGHIAPISNKDGEFPGEGFPDTVGQFKKLGKQIVIELCRFYEIIRQELPENFQPDQVESEEDFWKRMEKLTDDDIDGYIDELAKYLGLRVRRKAGW